MATPEGSQIQLKPGDLVCYEVDGEEAVGVYTGTFDAISASSPLAKSFPSQIELGKMMTFKTGSGSKEQVHNVRIKSISNELSRLSCLPDSVAA